MMWSSLLGKPKVKPEVEPKRRKRMISRVGEEFGPPITAEEEGANLTELEELTLRDEATVLGERIRRARRSLLSERQRADIDRRHVLTNGLIDLTGKLLDLMEVRRRLGHEAPEIGRLELLRAQVRVDDARHSVRSNRTELERAQLMEDVETPVPAPRKPARSQPSGAT